MANFSIKTNGASSTFSVTNLDTGEEFPYQRRYITAKTLGDNVHVLLSNGSSEGVPIKLPKTGDLVVNYANLRDGNNADATFASAAAVRQWFYDNTGFNTASGGSGAVVDKTLNEETYASSKSVAYDETAPNFYIDLAGNITLTITGITSGAGIVNLVRSSGSETITLTGELEGNHNYVTGAGEVVRLVYSYENGSLVWYYDRSQPSIVNIASSRNIASGDIGNTLACTTSATLTITSSFSAMSVGQTINLEAHGVTLTVLGGSGVTVNGTATGSKEIGDNSAYVGGILRKTGTNTYIVL